MKKHIFVFFILAFALQSVAYAQWPRNVKVVLAEVGKKVKLQDKLENGAVIGNLSWASNTAVGCFQASQNEKFRGSHVLYATFLPKAHTIRITVTPDDESTNVSVYAYLVGSNNFSSIPPNVSGCITCKSDFNKVDRPKPNQTVTSTRTIELKAIGSSDYNVVIGVAGAGQNVVSGNYSIEVEIKPTAPTPQPNPKKQN